MTTDAQLNCGPLVKSISIDNLLAQRDAVLERIVRANDVLLEAQEIARSARIADAASYHDFDFLAHGKDHYNRSPATMDERALQEARGRIDAAAWDLLMRESGLLTFMDSKARGEWREKIDKAQTPVLTRENIETTFAALYDTRGALFERGVINCFRKLSWDYKTNRPFKFGRRVIMRIRSYGYFDHRRTDDLEDLQRVFCVLDGKPEEDHRNGLHHRLSAHHPESRGEHDDTYMHIRWFKNSNGHITFKRPDLVDRMNAIIAKHFPGALAFDQHADDIKEAA